MSYDTDAHDDAAAELAPIANGGVGQVVTLTYTVTGAYDPSTGAPAITTVTQTTSGIERKYSAYRIDGTNILTGDTRFMVSPVKTNGEALVLPDALPEGATLTLASGAVKAVKSVEKEQPSGLLLYAYLQLRG